MSEHVIYIPPNHTICRHNLSLLQEEKKKLRDQKKQAKKLAAKAAELPVPEYFKERATIWTTLKQKFDEQIANQPKNTVKITLPDGRVIDGKAWLTTPFEVARGISSGLASDAIVAKVNGALWDLERPVEADCQIQLLKFDEAEAKTTFWLSAALLLGEALERAYGVESGALHCGIGATGKGFYADAHLKNGSVDLSVVQERFDKLLLNKTKFDRIEASKKDALDLFAYNPFQQRLIQERQGDRVEIYRSGNAFGLSGHPLLRHGKKIKVYKLLKVSLAS